MIDTGDKNEREKYFCYMAEHSILHSANGAGVGTGLLSMRERAELLGGTLNVESRPEGGTDLLARIPARD